MSSDHPTFVLNDQAHPWRPDYTVHDLMHELDPAMPIAVVKIDNKHVALRTWKQRVIRPDDQVRVVYIIAGG